MTRAMKIRAMPTIGAVNRLVRSRASVSCSVASAERMVAHFTACDAEYGARVAAGIGLEVKQAAGAAGND